MKWGKMNTNNKWTLNSLKEYGQKYLNLKI